ncbi:hypothetical protein J3T26_14860 [Salmonella enterica]|uniref:DUF6387 family protein n=1 Tax=Salmonella enterica TaxID=28901 RepID=UPI0021D4A13D|nr:DUF6387 family protein [Salmonella enterica]MCU7122016.1 hypothetical protein [Salmonella enterica]
MTIRRKSDLPEYFDLDKYKAFETLNDRDFYNQLLARHYMIAPYEYCYDENHIKEVMMNPVTEHIEDAFCGVYISKSNENNVVDNTLRLDGSFSVAPVDRSDFFEVMHSKKVVDEYDDSNIMGLMDAVSLIDDFNKKLFVKLDLHYPDEFIVDDLLSFLPLWRNALNISDPNNDLTVNSWEVVRAKILRYKIFPYADLLAWQKITGRTIRNSVFTVALYPDGEYSETQLSQTIKPFLEKHLSFFSLEKFEREIRDRLTQQKKLRDK